jgi:hypothetical protein
LIPSCIAAAHFDISFFSFHPMSRNCHTHSFEDATVTKKCAKAAQSSGQQATCIR